MTPSFLLAHEHPPALLDLARKVRCVECGSEPGDDCRGIDSGRRLAGVHGVRVEDSPAALFDWSKPYKPTRTRAPGGGRASAFGRGVALHRRALLMPPAVWEALDARAKAERTTTAALVATLVTS